MRPSIIGPMNAPPQNICELVLYRKPDRAISGLLTISSRKSNKKMGLKRRNNGNCLVHLVLAVIHQLDIRFRNEADAAAELSGLLQ